VSNHDIKKYELVQEYLGEVIDSNERLSRVDQSYIASLGDGWFVDSARMGNVSRFINHSCNPNCEFVKKRVDGYLRLGIFAVKDIKAGDFLSLDYQWGGDLTCKCGSPICKGKMNRNPNPRGK
jgi:SET domain-containing protein